MTTTPDLTRKVLRVLRRGPLLLGCVSLCVVDCVLHAVLRRPAIAAKSEILSRWSARVLSILGLQFSVIGPIPGHGLIASNHLSYLDILVFSAAAPCLFVSKSEVKSWPLVGWVASLTGSVFVDRSSRGQTDSVRPRMQERLQAGARLILFPEATSSDGNMLLPFHSSLFQAAVDASAPITAACISYEFPVGDGDPRRDACYWGEMTMFPHLIKLLTKSSVQANLRFAEHPQLFSDRKQAAVEMERQVKQLAEAGRQGLHEPDSNTSLQSNQAPAAFLQRES